MAAGYYSMHAEHGCAGGHTAHEQRSSEAERFGIARLRRSPNEG